MNWSRSIFSGGLIHIWRSMVSILKQQDDEQATDSQINCSARVHHRKEHTSPAVHSFWRTRDGALDKQGICVIRVRNIIKRIL